MREVTIYNFDDPERRKTIYSDSGVMGMTPDQKDLQMTLHDGYMQQIPRDNLGELTRLYFRTNLVRVRGVGNRFEQTEKDDYKSEREMSVCEMAQGLDAGTQDLQQARTTLANTLAAATHYLATGDQLPPPKVTKPSASVTAGSLYCKLATPIFGNAASEDSDSVAAARGATQTRAQASTPQASTPQASTPPAVVAAAPSSGAVPTQRMNAIDSAKAAQQIAARMPSVPQRYPPSSGRVSPPSAGTPYPGYRPPPKSGGANRGLAKSGLSNRGLANRGLSAAKHAIPPGLKASPSSGAPTTAGAAMRQLPGSPAPDFQGSSVIGRGRTFAPPNGPPNQLTSPAYLLSSAAQIEVMKARVHDSQMTMSRYEIEIQKKFALAAACVVFVLLGAPIGCASRAAASAS